MGGEYDLISVYAPSISLTMGLEGLPYSSTIRNLAHGFQTLPGMLGVIVAVVAGALGALIAVAWGADQALLVGVGVAAFLLSIGVLGVLGSRSISGYAKGLAPRFPSPK
jgi:hypothetical protein